VCVQEWYLSAHNHGLSVDEQFGLKYCSVPHLKDSTVLFTLQLYLHD